MEIKEHFLSPTQYFAGPTKKEWVFLHHTAGWDNPIQTIDIWNKDTQGQIATEFVLGGPSIKNKEHVWDGVMVQAFPTGGYAWHLGTGNNLMHKNSVGIEVCNFGQVVNGLNYVKVPVPADQIVKLDKPFRGHQFFHKYSDKQIQVLKEWILFIAKRDSIDVTKGLVELIKTKGAHAAFDFFDLAYCASHKGLWTHTNVRKDKIDMFPQKELVEMLLTL